MSCGLISSENEKSIRNTMHSEAERAARCLELVQNKIEEDKSNFELLIRVLQRDMILHERILTKLHKTYTSHPKHSPQGIITFQHLYE